MEKEIINYEPIELDSKAYRFFPTSNPLLRQTNKSKHNTLKKEQDSFFMVRSHMMNMK